MAKIIGTPILLTGGDSGDKYSTLPPPVTNLTAEAGNATVTLSFEAVPDEYQQYLSDEVAYIAVLKKGSIPESPTDGDYIVKLTKDGSVVTEGGDNPVEPVFPVQPSTYTLIDTYTADTTFIAPEDGYYQIEVFGASGKGGAADSYSRQDTYYCGTGGGGGSGGYSVSIVALKKGDTIILVVGSVGSTTSATVDSSYDDIYDHTLQVTSASNGGNGVADWYSDEEESYMDYYAGKGGAGGEASGGNMSNINGKSGGTGGSAQVSSASKCDRSGGTGGSAVVTGANAGGNGASVTNCSNDYNAGAGKAGFVKIYRGDTNITA